MLYAAQPIMTRRAILSGVLVLCCTSACVSAVPLLVSIRPFARRTSSRSPSFLPPSPSLEAPTTLSLALRGGGSSEDEEQEKAEVPDGPTVGITQDDGEVPEEAGSAAEEDDELSVEDEQDEEIAPEILDGDAVSVSAEAFIHPAHIEDEESAEDIETGDVVDGGGFYPAAEDEDEGSTTPVTPDDDDEEDEADSVEEGNAMVAEQVDNEAAAIQPTANKEEDEEEESEGPAVTTVEEVEHATAEEETDEAKIQSGSTFTDDESAAYVDRMDLADDEGEVPVVELEVEVDAEVEIETEATVPDDDDVSAPVEGAASSITDDTNIEDDDIDPLDLSEVQSTREALERERQATVAAATETARGMSASTSQDTATVQYMITRNMKRLLTEELGYTESEVDNMKPDVAAVLTSKRLKRPSTGMPDAFYVDGKAPTMRKNPLTQILKSKIFQRIILSAVGVGLSAFLTANAIQQSGIGSAATSTTGRVPSIQSGASSSTVAPAPEPVNNDEKPRGKKKSRKTTVDEQLNEAAALKTGNYDIPKDLNDSWVDRATSRLLEAFRFRR